MIAVNAIVRWATLLGALLLTVLAVLEIYRIVEYAFQIEALAERVVPPAQGVAANTGALNRLRGVEATGGPIDQLSAAASRLERIAAALEGRAGALARSARAA